MKIRNSVFVFLKRYSAFFVLSAILPVGLFLVLSSQNYSLFTKAARNLELRLWLEPRNVIIKPQQNIKLKLIGEFIDETAIIGGVTVKFQSDTFRIDPQEISYTKPFRGRLELGEITLTADQAGDFSLVISKENVSISSKDPVNLVTGIASVKVSN